jgi:hypothetical protein
METAGVVVGIAGLAGLFSSCVEAIEKIQSYMSFEAESDILRTRFKAAQASFHCWGREVGIGSDKASETVGNSLKPGPFENGVDQEVQDLLRAIRALCHEGDHSSTQKQSHPGNPLSSREPLALATAGGHNDGPGLVIRTSKRRKIQWALWGKSKQIEKVNDFEKLVQHLHRLVPLASCDHQNNDGHPGSLELKSILKRIEEEMASKFPYPQISFGSCG